VVEGPDDPAASPMAQDIMRKIGVMTGGNRLLMRSDFRAADFTSYLGNIILVDAVYGEEGVLVDGTVRLMGSCLDAFYGKLTGSSILTHRSEAGTRLLRSMQTAVDTRDMVILFAEQTRDDQSFYKVNSLVVPIADEGGNIVQFFAHLQPYLRSGEPYSGI